MFSAAILFSSHIFSLDAWDKFDAKKILNAPETLLIYDKNGQEVSRLHKSEDRVWVQLETIPNIAQKAFISAEDARFYEHIGVDFIRIIGAAIEDIKSGSYVQGASTISQQLIKLSHLSAEKTFDRKIEEAIMSYCMEQQFNKDDILEMYLNYVYFGNGCYGIEAAAMGYFNIHASELDSSQAALLAGILKSPKNYAPHVNYEASMKRRDNILNLMNEYGYLNEDELKEAKAEKIAIAEINSREKRGYYIDAALGEAAEILGVNFDELLTGGYRIKTAMDAELQNHIENMVDSKVFFDDENIESAIVITDTWTGNCLAIIGGRETDKAMAFNRATNMKRQPGSVIKPLICYAPALELYGYTAATLFKDEPTDFNGYIPKNFAEKYYGTVTLRKAVMSSLNVPAVKLLSEIGVENGKSFASKLGIKFDNNDNSLALALGGFTYGVSPMDIVSAYGAFSNGGYYTESGFVTEICDMNGKLIYERAPSKLRVMNESNAYILTSMLESAINEGTGKRLNDLNMEIAGKTGTVGDETGNRDAWMACYNSQIAAVIWMGYDDNKKGTMPLDHTGGNIPALMLKEVFKYMYEGKESPKFDIPEDIVIVRLDKKSLSDEAPALANAFTPKDSVFSEVFVRGTEPRTVSDYWSIPTPPDDIRCVSNTEYSAIIGFTAKHEYIKYRIYRYKDGGAQTLIATIENKTGFVSFTDSPLTAGIYNYFVIPVHSEMKILDKEVTGPASNLISVEIPEK